MSENLYFDILEKVYQLTNDTTPRNFDCGELCNKKCCGNLSKETHKSGMILLPYEKEFLLSKGAKYEYDSGDDGEVLICNGSCQRELRPFACRIFPYCTNITDSGIKLTNDLRAAQVCPLLFDKASKRAISEVLKKQSGCFQKNPVLRMNFKRFLILTHTCMNFIRKWENKQKIQRRDYHT